MLVYQRVWSFTVKNEENAEFHREKRGWWNSVLINKNMAFGVSKWCPQNATILYHFVGSTCLHNLEVHHRELNLSFVKNLDSNKHWLHFRATEMGRWQFGHHFGTTNLTTSTARAFGAFAPTFVAAFAVDPVIHPLNLWSFHVVCYEKSPLS